MFNRYYLYIWRTGKPTYKTIQKAFRIALSPPTGPTFVAFTTNALDDTTNVHPTKTYNDEIIIKPDENLIKEAAKILAHSKNPGILIGITRNQE